MIYYDRTDVSEVINVNRTSKLKECDIVRYWYFLMISMNLSDIAILNIKSADYCCIVGGISKSEAINLMQKNDLTEKSRAL